MARKIQRGKIAPIGVSSSAMLFFVGVELFQEYQLIIDHQKHISRYSFDIWVSKTDVGT